MTLLDRAPKKRIWIFAPFVFAFFGTTCTHGSVALALLFGATGRAGGSSENGHTGAGGTTVEVSVAGSEAPAAPEQTSAPEAPPPETKTATPKPLDPLDPEVAKNKLDPLPKTPPPPPSTIGSAETTSSGQSPGPTRLGLPNLPLSGDTVEGQRALLPHATTCSDPIAGRWEALKYNPIRMDWVRFTMRVQRAADGTLSGSILSHTWSGTMFDRDPPACSARGFDITVTMNASGRSDGGAITFGASRYSVLENRCLSTETSYSPDHFSGTIDVARQEFQSLNNDGFNDVNAPYVFRRTGCL